MDIKIKEYYPTISTKMITDKSGLIQTEKKILSKNLVYDIILDSYTNITFCGLTFDEIDGLFYLLKKIIYPNKENNLVDCGWRIIVREDYYVLKHSKIYAYLFLSDNETTLSSSNIIKLYNKIGDKLGKFKENKNIEPKKETFFNRIKKKLFKTN